MTLPSPPGGTPYAARVGDPPVQEQETADPAPDAPASNGRRRWWPRAKARVRQFSRRLMTLLGPFVVVGAVLWAIYVFESPRVAYELMILSAASLLWLGTTVIFTPILGVDMGGGTRGLELPFGGPTIEIHMGVWQIGIWLMFLNTAAAFLYAYNLDLLERVPVIGPYLKRARHNVGETLKTHPWIRRMAEAGIVLFVLSPLPGSGQLGGCFIGRVIGLPRRTTFFVVTLAGVAVATVYSMFAGYLARVLDTMEVETWMRVVLFVAALVFAWLIFKFLKYVGREQPATEAES